MSQVASGRIIVNGHPLIARMGESLLGVLRSLGVPLPAVCYHPALKPIGSCRLCTVEIKGGDQTPALRLACVVRTREGMEVITESAAIQTARQTAMHKLLSMAPQSETLLRLARDFKLETEPLPDGCIRCRLCLHVCRDVVGAAALTMSKKGAQYLIMPVADRCIGCGTCANICPTHAIAVTDDNDMRTISIRDCVIGRHPLAHCEGCGKPFATPRFLAYTHHRTEPHPEMKEHHNFCPNCAKLFSQHRLAG